MKMMKTLFVKLAICFISYYRSSWVSAFAPLRVVHRQHPTFTTTKAKSTRMTTATTMVYSSLREDDDNESIASSSTSIGSDKKEDMAISTNRLDDILSSLTSAFPFFVLGAATLGIYRPSTLMWTNRGNTITLMLALVMCGTGLTLTKDDFTVVLKKNLGAVPAGVLCQFLIMPMTAFAIGKALFLRSSVPYGNSLFLGLCLVGCSPGGTASNLASPL
jgi:multisubunit Na+/H+ antiporter MnhG subunit